MFENRLLKRISGSKARQEASAEGQRDNAYCDEGPESHNLRIRWAKLLLWVLMELLETYVW
jgi:hypothetical protein